MADEGLRIVTVEPDPDEYRMAYDVVSNATSWFCHHHLFDLPRRPRFDRHWLEAWEAYRRLQRAVRRGGGGRGRARGRPCSSRTTTSPWCGAVLAKARPDLRTVHFSHTPFADPGVLRTLPGTAAGELLAGMAGFGACGFHTARWEAAFRAAYARPGAGRPHRGGRAAGHLRLPARPGPGGHHRRGGVAGGGRGPGRARPAGGRPEAGGAGRPRGAVQEHPARVLGLRGAARDPAGVAGAGGASWRWPTPRARGWPSTSPTAPRSSTPAARINEAWGTADWTPVVLDVADDRDRLGGRPHPLRRAAGEPGARRHEPGGQGGPARQRRRRRAGALPRGRRLGGAATGRRSGSTRST